jgi:capsular exopolysaccharide synthesis family protein
VDLHKSELQKKYEVEGIKEGLNHFLSGLAEYEDVVYETNIPNGHIVPVTTLLENPSALLEDPRLGELLDRLAEDYRYVIIDTPPLDNISDGALIASMSDGAVLVVRCGETSKALVRQSLQQLDRVGCPVLGTVLNRAEIRSGAYKKYYNRYGKKYGDYYGDYYGAYYGGDTTEKKAGIKE